MRLASGAVNQEGASDITTVKQIYRADVSKAVPDLSYEAFDAKAIPLLAGITAACGRKELQGTFTTESGNPTAVKIALLTDKNEVAIQRWTATCDEAIECYRGAVSMSRLGMVADRFGVLWTIVAQERSAAANA
jgi:hypothetical protein